MKEIFPNWKSSEMKKEKLSSLILVHLLLHNKAFVKVFGNDFLTKLFPETYKCAQAFFCDPTCEEDTLSPIVSLFMGKWHILYFK